MRFGLALLMQASSVFMSGLLATSSLGAVIINIGQSGNNVVASISGGLRNIGSSAFPFGNQGQKINTGKSGTFSNDILGWGTTSNSYGLYRGAGTTNWRSSDGVFNSTPTASSLTGASYLYLQSDNQGFTYFGLDGYSYDNSPITGTMEFAGKTMSELGLENFGSHVYTFGSGADTDTVTVVLQAPGPRPGINVLISQVGNDVVATVSGGMLNLGDRFGPTPAQPEAIRTFKNPSFSEQTLILGTSNTNVDLYSGSGSSVWRSTNGFTNVAPTSSNITGASYMFFQHISSGFTYLALGDYNYDNTPISGTMTFSGKTLADLGIDNLGVYTYNYGSGERTGTVTFTIQNGGAGGGEVPEPSTMAIFGLGALGMAYRARRKAKA